MQTRTLLTILSLFVFGFLQAQTSRLSGRVVNEKNEPLTGVSILVPEGTGTRTDVDGNYSLLLSSGKKYLLSFSFVGYASKTVEANVSARQLNELNIVMQPKSKNLGGIVISTRSNSRKETVNALIAYQKNTNTVASVISAEAIRRSPDRNTGEVLKRIPGASIQEGKYLVVRGLSDRYNQAMLNGILLSSTGPDRKTF